MTVKELKELIKDLDDNMKVGGSGHFGEFLECYNISVCAVHKNAHLNLENYKEKETILCFEIESAGDEPD